MSGAAITLAGRRRAGLDLPAYWRRLRQAVQQAAERRRALRLLQDMDDRMLRDIGIGRSEILGLVGAWPDDTRRDR
jgi:uncharacterized protein YjiS (DUF1127 family)